MNRCPAPEELRRLLEEADEDPAAEAFAAHLEGCRACQDALEELTAQDPPPAPAPAAAANSLGPTEALKGTESLLGQLSETSPPPTSLALYSPPATRNLGTRLGPYEILAPLGRGGMAEVYRAKDIRLEREVAVKILPDELAQDPERSARFEREAKAVAALAHPNILVLYDFGRQDGIPFAVTELLEGTDLRRRLAAAASLPWREALEIGVAVAEGLAAAHAKGIIHRDLKPENIFLTGDGRVKILDFGLARLEAPPVATTETGPHVTVLTDPGTVMGTIGYMPPEQISGQPVDARGDIFSLGCVLYELIAGTRPFQGKTAAETTASLLRDEPPTLASLGAEVPSEVERVIRHCLAKEPGQRLPASRDLARALRAILSRSDVPTSPSPTAQSHPQPQRRRRAIIPSLAVLPLANTNLDPDTEYLSDGISESIINALSQLPGLRVLARSTVFRYKGQEVDPREVGRELKVRAVFTGQLVRRGQRLILKAELVDVKDGAQLWGEQYNRELSEVFGVERAIAHEIAEKLRVRLTGEQKRRLGQPFTKDPEAYQLYLRGRYFCNKRSEEGLKKSIKLFEQAIDIDPTYALAYTGVADAYINLGGWGNLPFREAYPRAKAAAMRALAIDETLAEAHVSLAMVQKEHDWDWASAGREYQRALELNPNYPIAHQWFGEYLAALGRYQEAITEFQRALELDPLSLIIHATLGRHGYYFARQYDQAIAQFQKTLEMDENFFVAHLFLGWTYANIGRLPEALTELQIARRLDNNLEITMGLAYTYARAGRRREAQQLSDELQQLSSKRYVSPVLQALIAIGLGEHDRAFVWLEKSYEDRAQLLSEIRAEPAFDPLRLDPRFGDLLQRVGLMP
jgi:serine/threonine-protein kinase